MKLPNFFIVGAPKCGTTSLYNYLKTHPNIFLPWLKEPHYFAKEMHGRRNFYTKSAEEYFSLFADANENHTAVGEASVFYLYSDVALENIRKFNNTAGIIVMLRNPADMVASLHAQMVYSLSEPRKDFEVAWRENKLPLNRACPTIETYAQVGKFAECIQRLFSIFPQRQVKIILLEDLQISPRKVYEDVLRFLGTVSDNKTYFPRVNGNKKHRIIALGRLTQKPPRSMWYLYQFINRLTEGKIHRIMKSVMQINNINCQREPISFNLRKEIIKELSDDIDRLSALLNRDLTHWKY